jgi:hypothetical protein
MSTQTLVLIPGPLTQPQFEANQEPLERLWMERTVVIDPTTNHRVYMPRNIRQFPMHSRVETQTTYRLAHPLQCFTTDSWTETSKQLSLLILDCTGMKAEPQKVKTGIRKTATSLAIFTVHHPGLLRMKRQTTRYEPFPQCFQQLLRLLPTSTVANQVSQPREPPPQLLSERSMNLSTHCAPITQPLATNPFASAGTVLEISSQHAQASALHVAYGVSAF